MPPWVGSPFMVRALPSNQRYVCIACCFIDSVHLLDRHSVDLVEGGEAAMDRESQYKKPWKCTVVIVDTYSLTIVQTVFHGNLAIGPLKYMAVISSAEDMEKQSVLMVDLIGKVQLVPITKNSHPDGEGGTGLARSSSHIDMTIWADGLSDGGQVVSIATCGQIIAFIYRTCCIFRLLASGIAIGEISFSDNSLCLEGGSTQSHVIGGMFLERNGTGIALHTLEAHEMFSETFAVWNNRGSAVVYKISYMDDIFEFESLCEIPAVSCSLDMIFSICFVQLNFYLLRIESICVHVEEPLLWKPHVTIWSLREQYDDHGRLCRPCKMLGEGGLFVDCITSSTHLLKTEDLRLNLSIENIDGETQLNSQRNSVSSAKNVNNMCADEEKYDFVQKGLVVSSSMVISENFYTPYAVVYGFYNGEIEVVRFDMFFKGLNLQGGSPRHEVDSHVSKQYLLGHTGAVLCLAAHQMVGTSQGWSFYHVLLSGSMDCTIRIWDLDTGNLIRVMRQHVAPVRQVILPPAQTERPWNDCFLSVGEDSCVALASLQTLRVERMFTGHPNYPAKVVWDGARGYMACLCQNHLGISDAIDVLYIWDIKTGARERVLRGMASHSMFDHFCKGINMNSTSGSVLNGNTSVSSLLLPIIEDAKISQSHFKNLAKGVPSSNKGLSVTNVKGSISSQAHARAGNYEKQHPTRPSVLQSNKHPIKCSCPFPGIGALSFDLALLMSPWQKHKFSRNGGDKQGNIHSTEQGTETPSPHNITLDDGSDLHETLTDSIEEDDWVRSLERCLLQFSLSFLHLWDVDCELDKLLITDMELKRPEKFIVASGLQGDRGSLTLTFPGLHATLELWNSSSEFSAMRSLTMVSLAQRMISLSHFSTAASSALAAFYTRNFAEKFPDIKPPSLQLLVSFWQDESEHVRMAARSLFHCAASRAIPLPLCNQRATDHVKCMSSTNGIGEIEHESSSIEETSTNWLDSDRLPDTQKVYQVEESKILAWIESFEVQDWISCVGGTSQDAMTSHIIVAAALAIWYPSLVKPCLAMLVVQPLMKLVMAMNEKYSSTAAELLAEGMERRWKACIGSEIPRLIGDIFFQIECVSGASANLAAQNSAVPLTIQETLVGVLLPSLAMVDIAGFLTVIESQIWSTASDSPVHLVSLMTFIRVVRGSPRSLAQYLDKAVNFILQTMDHGNSIMRRTCLQSSMTALKEVVRVFPMVALNDSLTRLAIGDAIGDINNASIRVYDMQSVVKIKILDASGPPGLPSLLAGASETKLTTAISALSFSPDGEGLVAFSEQGLMIRWWSLGSAWWEKLSRNLVPVQCTKLIFVPPWEGFSPNSSRSSIMATIMGHDRQGNLQENMRSLNDVDSLKLLIHNLDLSYRLEWVGERKVLLTRHGHELGTFQL
ncbi:hypothetical protein L1049_007041 [Liquidambar formosana]|uniref:Transducin/WD40 repeat-like superfamily protein n=1 Tax=Liquidambar formosana TaxID=63359 RepID=A0AAP0RGM8_LIQFO